MTDVPRYTPVVEANHHLSEKVHELEDELESVRAEKTSLYRRYRDLDNRVSNMSVRNEQLRRENYQLAASNADLRRENDQLSASNEDLQAENIANLEKEAQALREQVDDLDAQRRSSIGWKNVAQSYKEEGEKNTDYWTNRARDAEAVAARRLDRLNEALGESAHYQRENAKLQTKIEELTSQLRDYDNHYNVTIQAPPTESVSRDLVVKWRDSLNRQTSGAKKVGQWHVVAVNGPMVSVLNRILRNESPNVD
jgi:chromosome segregation ATPase